MLEDIAIQYVSQSETTLRLIGYGIAVVGGISAGLFHKSDAELRRALYFSCVGFLYLLFGISQLVWFIPAMIRGFLWISMLVDVVVLLAFGYGLAVIAMARSRHARGDGGLAFLAFIPGAFLWLFFVGRKRTEAATDAPKTTLLSSGLFILIGILFLSGGLALTVFIEHELTRMGAEAENDPAIQSATIETTLSEIAAEVPRQRVDETTLLLQAESDGTTLRYLYEVAIARASDGGFLPTSLRTDIEQKSCEMASALIEAGVTIEYVYFREDGSKIGTVTVTQEVCE